MRLLQTHLATNRRLVIGVWFLMMCVLTLYGKDVYNKSMEFIESPLFTDLVHDYISDHEYAAFQAHLALHPESGALIPGSGGLRKIRIVAGGKGKSGGARIIYYLKKSESEIWLLTIYAKNEAETLPIKILKQIAKELDL